MAIISLFTESLVLNNNIIALFGIPLPGKGQLPTPRPGDTLVLGGHQCSITALPGDYNYVIAADTQTLTGISTLVVTGTAGNPSPNVTVLAVEIEGAFELESRALPGVPGAHGANGTDGKGTVTGGKQEDPPTDGEDGTAGGPGSPGGTAVIHYCRASQPPGAVALGGVGGAAGLGGTRGSGIRTPPTIDGKNGAAGADGARGLREVTPVDPTQIWNALDAESVVEWAEFRGASITIWNRIEPRCRAQDLRAGLEARVFDPLWLLARQWQIGEFAGRDAGSPIAVEVTTTTHSFDRYAPGIGTGQTYDPRMPLEVLVEREAIRPGQAANDLRQAAEAGLHFARLLAVAGLSHLRGAYLAQYPLSAPVGASSGFGALIAGRVIDGVALHAAVMANPTTLPAKPALADADRPLVVPVMHTWLAWYGSLVSEPSHEPTWSQERMEYNFAIGAPGETGSFVAREYDGGSIEWHTFDKATAPLTGGSAQPLTTTRRALPSPVSFRGMPARRYWELEDGSVDIGALTAGPEDLGRLLLREFALVYGTDWFLIPLRVPVGSVTNIDAFKVADTFGQVTVVPHYAAADGPGGRWRMFALSADESSADAAPDPRLLILPSAVGILDSEAVEEVLLLRDELANMVWGVERSALGPEGVPIDRALAWRTSAPALPPPAAAGVPYYRLGSAVPDYWIPFLPVLVNGPPPENAPSLRFRRGRLPTTPSAPLGAFLRTPGLTLFPEEVPREGVHLERKDRYARGRDGSTYVWRAWSKSTGRGEGRSGLGFDYLEF